MGFFCVYSYNCYGLLWFSYVTSLPSLESWVIELTLILLSINNIILLMFISFLVIVPGFEEGNLVFYLKSYSKQGFYRVLEWSDLLGSLLLFHAMEYIDLAKNGHQTPRFRCNVVFVGNQSSMYT